jgi:hypothetical protein
LFSTRHIIIIIIIIIIIFPLLFPLSLLPKTDDSFLSASACKERLRGVDMRRCLAFFALLLQPCHLFVLVPTHRITTALSDIHEWRDIDFDLPGQRSDSIVPPKQICILPFAFPEVLLQGETKQLRLYEERFLKLFEDVMENHGGLVAMGLLADSGMIQTVPLCEIEAYNRMEGFGIFCTIRVVGRAQVLGFQQQEPYLKVACLEVIDQLPPNLELPNLIASQIENLVLLLSSMEHKLKEAKATVDDDDEENKEMQRRIELAKLVGNNQFCFIVLVH